ncbi:hypothetical protein AVEN_203302-1 [Araneus ventricosus]|uniref:Uncharacterized protein n=1 Tax=Araneus ventricosus TaxID=182803 RepID=A0A4Y2CTF1_ARAVE|nr:hypothetical protein AVEN_47899-1 [Araneus ventricosus]GBM07399.1 hypothetical protein AVEN_203302-1 [Araneus ventricosus]
MEKITPPGWESPIHVVSSQKVTVLKELEEKSLLRIKELIGHPNIATSYWKIKLFLKNLCTSNSLRDLQTRTALKGWRRVSPSSIPDKPRRDAVAAFRLTTGHYCLAAHLHRLGISTEPFCPLCDSGEVMERDHLFRCGALQGLTEVSRNSKLSINRYRIIRDNTPPKKESADCGRWNVREDRILFNPSYCIGLV